MRAALIVALAMVVPAEPADACSLSSDLRIEPTFVEKVEQSFAIVIASIDTSRDTDANRIRFVVREVFKGPIKVGTALELPGEVDQMPCGGRAFFRTEQYVLELTKDGWAQWSFAIPTADTGTRYAIAEVVRIGTLPTRDARTAALRVAQSVQRTETRTDTTALALTIDDHFRTPTPSKTFAELWPMLRLRDRDSVIHSIGLGGDPDAATFMTEVLHVFRTRRPMPREELHAIAEYFAQVHVPAAAADLRWLSALATSAGWPWSYKLVEAERLHAADIHELVHAK